VLVDAIHDAVMTELAANGYDALSIERVAERARTGKASIYRRWPTKLDLVLDAVDSAMPSADAVPDSGDLRGDLLCVLRRIARYLNTDAGGALRACMADVKHHRELSVAVHERLVEPRKRVMRDVLQRAVDRGEVRPERLTDRVLQLGPTLLHAERHQRGAALRDADVVAIVDEVLLPLLCPRA
jgi:AcrR family transcriptional regulator